MRQLYVASIQWTNWNIKSLVVRLFHINFDYQDSVNRDKIVTELDEKHPAPFAQWNTRIQAYLPKSILQHIRTAMKRTKEP